MKVQLQRYNDGRFYLTLLHNNGSLPSVTWLGGKNYRDSVYFLESDRIEEPVLAEQLGWNRKIKEEACLHISTDGTVDCLECGIVADTFLLAAQYWLRDHLNQTFPAEKVEHYFL